MSFYHMIFGINPLSKILLDIMDIEIEAIERFRDCGYDKCNQIIWIYTRTGGNNRESYPNKVLTENKYYKRDYDDKFDNTYATYEFDISNVSSKIKDKLEFFNEDLPKRERPDWEGYFKNIKEE